LEYEHYFNFTKEYNGLLRELWGQRSTPMFVIKSKMEVYEDENFFQEEYDLKLLLEGIVTRIDAKSC